MSGEPHSDGDRAVRARRPFVPAWMLLFLAGPTIWYLYFWAVYLGAEALCSQLGGGEELLGVSLLSALVALATALAAAPIVWFALRARKVDPSQGHRSELARTGAMLGFVFAFATLFVGLPAVVFPPC